MDINPMPSKSELQVGPLYLLSFKNLRKARLFKVSVYLACIADVIIITPDSTSLF